MKDFEDGQKVVAYRNNELAYEGLWGKRPDWLNDSLVYDWYLLNKIEDADIIIVVAN